MTADIIFTKYPTYQEDKVFDLNYYVSDHLIHSHSARETIMALILMFNRKDFISTLENDANNPCLPGQPMPKRSSIKAPHEMQMKSKSKNCTSSQPKQEYVIDSDGNYDNDPNSIAINIDCNDENYDMIGYE